MKQKIVFGPALGAGDCVVLGGDADHLADRRFVRARRRAEHGRLAADDLHRVVIDVLVRDEQEIGASRPRSAGSRTRARAQLIRSPMSPNGSMNTVVSPRDLEC